jgi:hypothetical protein
MTTAVVGPQVKESRRSQIRHIRRARLAKEKQREAEHKAEVLDEARESVERSFSNRKCATGLGKPVFAGMGDGVRGKMPDGHYRFVFRNGRLVPAS